jgi:hypothetical protein
MAYQTNESSSWNNISKVKSVLDECDGRRKEGTQRCGMEIARQRILHGLPQTLLPIPTKAPHQKHLTSATVMREAKSDLQICINNTLTTAKIEGR